MRLTLFVLFWGCGLAQNPSPCPDILTYESRDDAQGRWYGKITLTTNEDLNGVWLRVILDRQAELLGNWFGDASSSDNREFLIKNPTQTLKASGEAVTVKFFVKYNMASIIPSVTGVRLNGRMICPRSGGGGGTTTTERQLHLSQFSPTPAAPPTTTTTTTTTTRRPPPRDNNNNGYNRRTTASLPSTNNNANFEENTNTNNNNNKQPLSSDDDDFFPGATDDNVQCGTVRMNARPLITFGSASNEGQWPWHTALYRFKGVDLAYICGGTLVSRNHVVTAAHCVTKSRTGVAIDPDILLVYLGKHNLHKVGSNVQDFHVTRVIVHPNYNASFLHNDIAILKLEREVQVTDHVRPICLWEDSTSLNEVVDKQGTVVGWGFDENGRISEHLQHARMPVVSTETCIFSNRDFFSRFTSSNTFCAGFRNGTSACTGDSGGGMVFPRKGSTGARTIWQLRGVISLSAALQNEELLCDTKSYIVFADAAKHLDWIRSVTNSRN